MPAPRVYIYTADVASLYDEDVFARVYGAVNVYRRAKTDSLRFLKDKCLSLGAEYLLMQACRDTGIDYKAQSVTADACGKPCFDGCPLQFNLSHSGERAMCIISDAAVGCDVEKTDGVNTRVADRFFSDDEKRALNACTDADEKTDLFYRLWTLKESFIKCTGLGLRMPLNSFSVSVEGDTTALSLPDGCARYILRELPINDGFKYAWCLRCPDGAYDEPEPVIRSPSITFI